MNRIRQPHSRVISPVPSIRTLTCFSVSRVEQIFRIIFVSIEWRRLRKSGTALPLPCKPSWRGQGVFTQFFYHCVRITISAYWITYILLPKAYGPTRIWNIRHTNLSRFHQFILTVFSLPCISHCFWSDFLLNFSIYSLYPLKRKFKLTNKPHAHKIKTKITAAEAFISNSYRNVYLYTKLNVLPLFKFQTKYKL